MIPKANPAHKFLVTDMNGLTCTSATTMAAALNRARAVANTTGTDMYVSYSTRYGRIGMLHHSVIVRRHEKGARRTEVSMWTLHVEDTSSVR